MTNKTKLLYPQQFLKMTNKSNSTKVYYKHKTESSPSIHLKNTIIQKKRLFLYVVSLRIQSSLSFLYNTIGEICNALQEIFDSNQIFTIVNANSYRSNRMDARQLEQYELAALKALLGILIKFLASDSDAILKIEHQQDNMFNRNTLLFKTLGKAAFSLQKDLNRELANRFKKHIQLKFLGFSTKIFNLNQNLFTIINPNQPNTLLIVKKPKSFRRYHKGFNRKKNNKMRRKFRQQRRFRRRN